MSDNQPQRHEVGLSAGALFLIGLFFLAKSGPAIFVIYLIIKIRFFS
jgi:hypothetical protein